MLKSFRGGVHIDAHKDTAGLETVPLPAPDYVSVPLTQHIGAPCDATVAVGDSVLRYQKIGESLTGLSCPVHSPISGKVTAIKERRVPAGTVLKEVVIENDFQLQCAPLPTYDRDLKFVSAEEKIDRIRQAGISGMGGATFPAYAKIQSALGKVDTVIINCAECEPYITADHRLLLEQTDIFLRGVADLAQLFDVKTVKIGIEDNKRDAKEYLEKKLQGSSLAQIIPLRTKYPQGDERQMIYALTGREIPAGKLPADVGCAVFNAQTCYAISRALHEGIPLVERIVTVAGDCIRNPKNLLVPLGTPYEKLIAYCGGFVKEPERLIAGGPMMGRAQWDLQSPVTKGTNALLALSDKQTAHYAKNPNCIRCGRCVAACPMRLLPCNIVRSAKAQEYGICEELGVLSCTECGTCSCVCPAQIPLVQHIGVAKASILQAKRLKAMAQAASEKKG